MEELLPFDHLNVNTFFAVLSHTLVSNKGNFIKFILSIYDHSVMMQVNFHEVSSV